MNIRISFIIPLYNAERTIERCVRSVLAVMESTDECIIVNDGSTDRSAELLAGMKLPSHVTVFTNENHGVSYSRNFGIRHATGEYIMFVDSDDQITDELTALRQEINNEDLVVFGWKKEYFSTPAFRVICQGMTLDREAFFREYNRRRLHPCVYLYIWNKLYRREVIERLSVRYREDMSLGEDCVFNASFLGGVNSVRFSKRVVYIYNNKHSAGSLSLQKLAHAVENSYIVTRAQYDSVREVLGETPQLNSFVFAQFLNCYFSLYSHAKEAELDHLMATYYLLIGGMTDHMIEKKYFLIYDMFRSFPSTNIDRQKVLKRYIGRKIFRNAVLKIAKKCLRRS